MKVHLAALALATASLFARSARSEDFGAKGQLVVTGASSAGVGLTLFERGSSNTTSAVFSPGVDWFFVRNVSLGVDLDVRHRRDAADETTSFALAPRVGVNITVRPFSFYPRLALGGEWEQRRGNTSLTGISAPSYTQAGPWVELFAPVLAHPTSHFFMGFGPVFFHQFGHAINTSLRGFEVTTVGVRLVVGGHFATNPFEPAVEDETRTPGPRFGDGHDIVFSGEAVADGLWTTRQDASGSTWSSRIEPGVDYFVGARFSLGLGLLASWARTTGPTPIFGGPSPVFLTTRVGVAPRIGYDLPISRGLSLYPRLSIGMGRDASEGSYTVAVAYAWVGLYAPLLVHLAPHLFAGFGPYVSQDLWRELRNNLQLSTYASAPRATSIGLSLLVGGWLRAGD
jgi:hypothetical protein